MNTTKRNLLIVASLIVGTLLSALLMQRRYGELGKEQYLNLMVNMLFGVAIVVGLAWFFSRNKK